MKVLLVEPPKRPWAMMGDFIAPPIGLAQLAAVLEADLVDVEIVDCNASRLHGSPDDAQRARVAYALEAGDLEVHAQVRRQTVRAAVLAASQGHLSLIESWAKRSQPRLTRIAALQRTGRIPGPEPSHVFFARMSTGGGPATSVLLTHELIQA